MSTFDRENDQERTDGPSTDLLRKARAGDRASARRVHDLCYPVVFRLCERLLRHHADAEDAAQDIMVGVLARGDEPEAFWSWLRVVSRHHCFNMMRARVRRVAWIEGEPGSRTPAVTTGVATKAHRRESRESMNRKIDALPLELMEVVLFHYGPARLTRPEIAEMLQLPEPEVRRRLDHARTLLSAGPRPAGA